MSILLNLVSFLLLVFGAMFVFIGQSKEVKDKVLNDDDIKVYRLVGGKDVSKILNTWMARVSMVGIVMVTVGLGLIVSRVVTFIGGLLI